MMRPVQATFSWIKSERIFSKQVITGIHKFLDETQMQHNSVCIILLCQKNVNNVSWYSRTYGLNILVSPYPKLTCQWALIINYDNNIY